MKLWRTRVSELISLNTMPPITILKQNGKTTAISPFQQLDKCHHLEISIVIAVFRLLNHLHPRAHY